MLNIIIGFRCVNLFLDVLGVVDQREKGVVQLLFLVCKVGAFFSVVVLGWNIDFDVLVKACLPPGLIKCFAMFTFYCFIGKQRRKHLVFD